MEEVLPDPAWLAEVARREQVSAPSGPRPLVSVICPTTEERLPFHSQLYDCFAASEEVRKELVVVDTGLTGPSPVLSRLAKLDSRVVYAHFRVPSHEWSVGLKRNVAAQLATGEVIAHFDDDDLYSPAYLTEMLRALGGADAVTLSCWFVFDLCTGLCAHVDPLAADIYDAGWAYGYGFSYVYRREACLEAPFPNTAHFAEDSTFLARLQTRRGSRGVALLRDDRGLVLHLQHGGNLSNSHAHREVPLGELERGPLKGAPGFAWYREAFGKRPRRTQESAYITLGAACALRLRPSERWESPPLLRELRRSGVVASEVEVMGEAPALVSLRCSLHGQTLLEPGREFWPAERFPGEAKLPGDVARVHEVERLALLHVLRLILRRCTSAHLPHAECVGVVRLHLRSLPGASVLPLCAALQRHLPALRLEVIIGRGKMVQDHGYW